MGQLAQEMAAGRKPLDFGLHQLEQTLIMRGNVQVKSEAAIALPHRRSARSIIKAEPPSSTPGRAPALPTEPAERPESPAGPEVIVADQSPPAPVPAEQSATEPAAEPPLPAQAEQPEGYPGAPPEAVMEAEAVDTVPLEPESSTESVGRESGAAGAFGTETADAEELAAMAAALPAEAAEAFLSEESGAGRPCPACGQPLVHKEDRFGPYVACSGFPACRYVEAGRQEEEIMACPLCRQGGIMATRTASGRTIYVCRSEGCDFLAWSRPHAGRCPVCQAPYLVERKRADGGTVLGCPRNGCSYSQEQGLMAEPTAPDGPRKVRVRVVKRAGAAPAGKRKVVVVRRKK